MTKNTLIQTKKIAELISLRQIFDVSSLFCTERVTCW